MKEYKLNFYRPSPKSLVVFIKWGMRRANIEFNWCVKKVMLSIGTSGNTDIKIF